MDNDKKFPFGARLKKRDPAPAAKTTDDDGSSPANGVGGQAASTATTTSTSPMRSNKASGSAQQPKDNGSGGEKGNNRFAFGNKLKGTTSGGPQQSTSAAPTATTTPNKTDENATNNKSVLSPFGMKKKVGAMKAALPSNLPSLPAAQDISEKQQPEEYYGVQSFRIPVVVTMKNDKKMLLLVDPYDTLSSMKHELEKASGLQSVNQKLTFSGRSEKELDDDLKTALEYGIKPYELKLFSKLIKIKVHMPEGEFPKEKQTVFMEISCDATSDEIKTQIELKTGMLASRQVLKMRKNGISKELPKDKKAKDMEIEDGTEMDIEIYKVTINLKTMDGKKISMVVEPTTKLGVIKKQLEDESGVSMENQRLFMNSVDQNELGGEDGMTLAQHGIVSGGFEQQLIMEPKLIKIKVDIMDIGSGKKQIFLDVKPPQTMKDIKEKLAKETGVQYERQVLKYDGKVIPNEETTTVRGMGIKENASFVMDLYKIPIVVKTNPQEKTINLMIEPISTIEDIKKVLIEHTGLPVDKQALKLDFSSDDDVLEDAKSANDYGIVARSILILNSLLDEIIFVDIKAGTLFGMERDLVIQKTILTPNPKSKEEDKNLDFMEAAKYDDARRKIKETMMSSPRLGFSTQVVVEKSDIDNYEIDSEDMKSKWGVSLKKREKNKKGEEFIFVDPKTYACGELSRQKYIDNGFITPIETEKGEHTLKEAEHDAQNYDRYIRDLRDAFGVKLLN